MSRSICISTPSSTPCGCGLISAVSGGSSVGRRAGTCGSRRAPRPWAARRRARRAGSRARSAGGTRRPTGWPPRYGALELDLDARAVVERPTSTRLVARHLGLVGLRCRSRSSKWCAGLLLPGARGDRDRLAGRELPVHARGARCRCPAGRGSASGGGTSSRRAASRRSSAPAARTMPGPLSSTVMRKRVSADAGAISTRTSGRMPASSQASSELSTAFLDGREQRLAHGLSKPSRWRFFAKNSETEISRCFLLRVSAVTRGVFAIGGIVLVARGSRQSADGSQDKTLSCLPGR